MMAGMKRAARRCSLWLGLGLMTWSLQACIAPEPKEDEDSSGKSSGKKTEDDKTPSKTKDDKTPDKTEEKTEKKTGESDPKKGGSVSGVAVDEKGEPVGGMDVQVCGTTCLPPASTDDDGKFKVTGVDESWKHYHAAVLGNREKSMFFVGTIVAIDVDSGLEHVDVGEVLHQVIDEDVKSEGFRDVKEKTVFETGKFSFELNPENMDPGFFADPLEDKDSLYFAVAEVDKKNWREEEKEIEGKKIEAVWGVFPFGGYMKEGKGTASLKIDDDLGFDEGAKIVVFEQHYFKGTFLKAGSAEVKDGKIELEDGVSHFTRLYFAEE